jgi:hypothetical protein
LAIDGLIEPEDVRIEAAGIRANRINNVICACRKLGGASTLRDRDHRNGVLRSVGSHPIAEKAMQRFCSVGTKLRVGRHLAGELLSGAEVDVPTSLYCISFVPYRFRKTFAAQSELLAYTHHVIDRFGLRKHARPNQTVTRLVFDEREFLWHVETESGERYTARFVIDTSGVLANPHVPNINGAETFKGPQFHSGHWDHAVPMKANVSG